ncbi:unnamed protein product, partial [Ixodes pacificus]
MFCKGVQSGNRGPGLASKLSLGLPCGRDSLPNLFPMVLVEGSGSSCRPGNRPISLSILCAREAATTLVHGRRLQQSCRKCKKAKVPSMQCGSG